MEDLKIYDCDRCKFVTENEIRKDYLREETSDIFNNFEDYIDGNLNIDSQIKCIKSAITCTDIKYIVKKLNELWGYNIKIYKEEKI